MAAVPLSYRATLYDLANKRSMEVYLEGDASITGLGIGGGPLPPGQGGGQPPGIWGPPGPWPSPPIHLPPGQGGGGGGQPPGQGPHPEHPIVIVPVPPDAPNVPPPGSPPVIIGGTQPVQPMTPPPAIIVQYPGIGKVVVPQPTQTAQPGTAGQ